MTVGIVFRLLVLLDERKDLAAIHPGKIEVQQDQIRAGRLIVGSFPPQEGHRFHPVIGDVQTDGEVGIAESLPGQPHVARTVLDQQNLDDLAVASQQLS